MEEPSSTLRKKLAGTQMDRNELTQLWMEYPSNRSNEALRNRLVEVYLPLVKDHAERVWTRLPESVELDDLVSAGTFGLIDAVESFDPERGVKFELYCVPRIRGAMMDHLHSLDWVPVRVRKWTRRLAKAADRLQLRLGRKPNDGELAEEMGLSLYELQRRQREWLTVKLLRLDERRHASRQCSRARPTGPLEDPAAELCAPCRQQDSFLPHFARSLNRTERLVVILFCFEELTLKEIGQTLDLPETGVAEMIRSLQQRLRHDDA